MHSAQRVNTLISQLRSGAVCDSCIARALDINAQMVNRTTIALGTTSDFERRKGLCADCNRAKMVIQRGE